MRACVYGHVTSWNITLAEPHYGQKTGRSLVKLAQMAGMDKAEYGPCSTPEQLRYEALIVKDDIQKGTVHVDATIVVQKAQLPEPIHEEADP